MEAKRKAAPSGNGNPMCQSHDKCSEYSPLRQIRMLFRNGGAYTAKEINQIVGTNDARKFISIARADGMQIKDVRLDSGCKRYWLEPDDTPTLFGRRGGGDE
jgi:hypothetical protein